MAARRVSTDWASHLLADGLEPNGGRDAQRRQQDGEQAKAEPQRAARAPRTHGLRDHALGDRAEDARREEHEGRGRIQGHADESGQVTERFRPGGVADQGEAGDGRSAEREHIDHETAPGPGLDGGRGTSARAALGTAAAHQGHAAQQEADGRGRRHPPGRKRGRWRRGDIAEEELIDPPIAAREVLAQRERAKRRHQRSQPQPQRRPMPPPQRRAAHHEGQRGVELHGHQAGQDAFERLDAQQPPGQHQHTDGGRSQRAGIRDAGEAGLARPVGGGARRGARHARRGFGVVTHGCTSSSSILYPGPLGSNRRPEPGRAPIGSPRTKVDP